MQKLFLSKLIAYEYFKNKKNNYYPKPAFQRCKHCGKLSEFKKHGFYERYYTCGEFTGKIFIRRYICANSKCNHTISMLPNFCHPRFINGIEEIFIYLNGYFNGVGNIELLIEKLNKATNMNICRQLLTFYSKRFIKNLTYIQSTLRLLNPNLTLPEGDDKEKAKQVLTIINTWSSPTKNLSQKFHDLTSKTLLCKQISILF